MSDLGNSIERTIWPMPDHVEMRGRYVQLSPLNADHTAALWPAVHNAPDSFAYLRYGPFKDKPALRKLINDLASRSDQPFWAVTPHNATPQGWLSLCDISQHDGAIEIGSICFSPALQGTRAGREALYLPMRHAMDDLGYEQLVWRCQTENARSHAVALALGFTFEGTWRNAAVLDGFQRGVSWFSILSKEWPARRRAFEHWLSDDNFDAAGRPLRKLRSFLG